MIIQEIAENGIIFALTGAFTGLMSGILGIGGGMIVVPALVFIFHHTHLIAPAYEMHVAAGSSFAIMIFTAQASVRAHHKKSSILWNIYFQLAPGIILGAISGALTAAVLSTHWLKIILGVVLFFIGIKMLFNLQVTEARQFPPRWIDRLISFIIGFKSGLLGIGGGAVIVPYLSYCGIDPRKIPAVSAICTLTVSIIGTIAFIYTGYHRPGLPADTTGFLYWPAIICIAIPSMLFAPLGASLTYILPRTQLKYGFVLILFFASISLIF